MKKRILQILVAVCLLVIGIVLHDWIKGRTDLNGHKTVICIPVFGQSYALGEEAKRITDFDSLRLNYDGRIVNEKMDYVFGYFDHSSQFKQYIKRLLYYDRKAFELSVYGMAESLVPQLGEDTIICIFPGGHGQTTITQVSKPDKCYNKFIKEIKRAYQTANEKGWDFNVPAICWMQGESDIAEYPDTDYKMLFHQILKDFNTDIKQITHQENDIRSSAIKAVPSPKENDSSIIISMAQKDGYQRFRWS